MSGWLLEVAQLLTQLAAQATDGTPRTVVLDNARYQRCRFGFVRHLRQTSFIQFLLVVGHVGQRFIAAVPLPLTGRRQR